MLTRPLGIEIQTPKLCFVASYEKDCNQIIVMCLLLCTLLIHCNKVAIQYVICYIKELASD